MSKYQKMATPQRLRNAPGIVAVAAGEYIFRIGDPAMAMYLIIERELDRMPGGAVIVSATEGAFVGATPKIRKKSLIPQG